MPVIEGKKFACATCIKGHRSSSCQHTDRPVFEIKRKGRPPSQCPKCRHLRKSQGVHVKCVCKSLKLETPLASPIIDTLPVEVDQKTPNLKALKAIHKATIQRAYMCQCLTGGSCICGPSKTGCQTMPAVEGQSPPESSCSSKKIETPGGCCASKRSKAQDHLFSPYPIPVMVDRPTSCCSSLPPAPTLSVGSTDTAAYEDALDPSLYLLNEDPFIDIPPFAPEWSNSEPLMYPSCGGDEDNPLEKHVQEMYPPSSSRSPWPGDSPVDTAANSQIDGPLLQKEPLGMLFNDWVFGDVYVPEELLSQFPPGDVHQETKSGCTGCGDGCSCGDSCSCSHVYALHKWMLREQAMAATPSLQVVQPAVTAPLDTVDQALFDQILGLPSTQDVVDAWKDKLPDLFVEPINPLGTEFAKARDTQYVNGSV